MNTGTKVKKCLIADHVEYGHTFCFIELTTSAHSNFSAKNVMYTEWSFNWLPGTRGSPIYSGQFNVNPLHTCSAADGHAGTSGKSVTKMEALEQLTWPYGRNSDLQEMQTFLIRLSVAKQLTERESEATTGMGANSTTLLNTQALKADILILQHDQELLKFIPILNIWAASWFSTVAAQILTGLTV